MICQWGKKKWKMSLPKMWSQKWKIWQSFNVWSNNLVNIFIKLFLKDFTSNTSNIKRRSVLWTGKITTKMLFCLNVWKAIGFSQSYGCHGSRRPFVLLFLDLSTNSIQQNNWWSKTSRIEKSFRFYKRLNFHWAIFKIRCHDKQWTDLLILLLQNITLKCGKIIESMTMNSLILDWMTHFFFNLVFKQDSLPPKISVECEVLNSSFFLVNINIWFYLSE